MQTQTFMIYIVIFCIFSIQIGMDLGTIFWKRVGPSYFRTLPPLKQNKTNKEKKNHQKSSLHLFFISFLEVDETP